MSTSVPAEKTDPGRRAELRLAFAAAGLPGFVALTVTPLAVIGPSHDAFAATPLQVLAPFLVATLIVWALLAVGVGLLPPRHRNDAVVACAAAAVPLLITGQIFSPAAGALLDGGAGELRIPAAVAWTEIVVLLVVMAGLAAGWRRLRVHRRPFAGAVAAWAVASAVVPATMLVRGRPGPENVPIGASLQSLSTSFNVVHVMFDSMQADAFQAVIARRPDLRDELEGFIHFADHSGYANWTASSLPAILGGLLIYDVEAGDREPLDLITAAVGRDGLPGRLAGAGFDVAMISPSGFLCRDAPQCTTLAELSREMDLRPRAFESRKHLRPSGAQVALADFTVFRLAPLFLKPRVHRQGRWLIAPHLRDGDAALDISGLNPLEQDVMTSVALGQRLARTLTPVVERPVYRFLHFYPPHRPFILDGSCALVPDSDERAPEWTRYEGQVECALAVFAGMLRRLREIGTYEDTLLILQSDTGLGMVHGSGEAGETEPITRLHPGQVRAYARPVLLVKLPGARGPLRTIAHPTHHSQTMATIARVLKDAKRADLAISGSGWLDAPLPGGRPFVLSDAVRVQTHTLGTFHRYSIEGPVDVAASWRDLGLFVAPGSPLRELPPVTSVALEITPGGPRRLRDRIHLRARAKGGSDRIIFTFFRRFGTGGNDLARIQPWSPDDTAEWSVHGPFPEPCAAHLLVAARNEADPESAGHAVGQVKVPLFVDGCPPPSGQAAAAR